MTVEEARANIGADVTYSPRGGPVEHGVIVSAGTHYVCVRYTGEIAAKATLPRDLKLRGTP